MTALSATVGHVGDYATAIDALRSLEDRLHAHTRDWPGDWPAPAEPIQAWTALGRPHTLLLWAESGTIARVWLTPDGQAGADCVELSDGGRLQDAAVLIPRQLVASLTSSGCADDLVIAAPDDLRALPYPMLRLPCHDGERLNSFAAVSLLPSLSWGAHARARRTAAAHSGSVVAYLDPALDLHRVAGLIRRVDTQAQEAGSLADLGRHLVGQHSPAIVLIGAHGRITPDGSIDVRDHTGRSITPEDFATWQVPSVAMLVGCRTATGNGTAPLHLVEAALVAGANHIVAATAPMTDEVADRVLARVLVLLGVLPSASAAGMAPSQALQGALQQFDRAFPYPSEDLTDWPIVHVGLPGSAG